MPVERLKEAIGIFGRVFVNLYGQMEAPMTITWLGKGEHTGKRLSFRRQALYLRPGEGCGQQR